MRPSLIILVSAIGISSIAGIASGEQFRGERSTRLQFGCGKTTPDDSAGFLETFQEIVSGSVLASRTFTGLPKLPADSVRFGGTDAQCDTVKARYDALRTKETGIRWQSDPVLLLRIGPSHWVADPKVGDPDGGREWIVLDSQFRILKVFHTTS